MATSQSLEHDPSSGLAPSPQAIPQLVDNTDADAKRDPIVVETKLNPEYVTGVKLALIVATVGFASFLILLDLMIVSTAIPKITDEFHSLGDVGWYASAYQFGSAAPQPLTGKVYKYFNTKWTFLVTFAIFEIGSLICAVAKSSPVFIVGRFIAGFGGAGVATGTITMVSNSAPLEKRAGLLGLTLGFNLLGIVLGPLIGGVFTSYVTWRWCFYINLPIGAVAALTILVLRIPEPTIKPRARSLLPRLHHHLDLIGFVLFAPAILQLLLALQFGGQTYPWNSSQVIGLFVGAAATFAVWFLWNRRRGEDAMMPRALIRQKNVLAAALYNACQTSALYAGIYYLPIYFQAVKEASAVLSGVYLLPLILFQLLFAGASGGAVQKIGYIIPITLFASVFLSTGTGLLSLLQPDTSTARWVGFQILVGVGFGAGLQMPIIAVQAAMDGEELASGVAFMVFSQAIGPAIANTLYNVIFLASLPAQIAECAPRANVQAIIDAGASGFRSVVEPADLNGVLVAYSNSLGRIYYLAVAFAAICGVAAWGMGWHDLRKKEVEGTEAKTDGTDADRSVEEVKEVA
ncbi:MFS general substrate transporter [Hypoxylon rubiginosum]|uniref:MFS general substrate transporter n=1 Tax=Hypoxylon rubiginosum TaxID=110542 RepID=A0ACC0DE63_9PEZI|nr:MFS general substrate transporter [Hypoxylon rubiginosum]